MIVIEWGAFLPGVAVGAVAGVLYFAGLALGIHLALRANRAAPVLIASAGLRMALLLTAVWYVLQMGAMALVGFALAFLLARLGAIAFARRKPAEPATWN